MLNVRVKNEGSSATSGTVSVSNPGQEGPLQIPDIETGTLEPGAEKVLGFEVTISDHALPGTIIPYDIKFVCGKYETQGRWFISTGKTRETWEFERFDVFPWIQKEEYPWTITSLTSFENVKSARSAIIPNKAESVLSIFVNNPVRDTVSFYTLVSSEANYDSLIFRVDSVNTFELSGDIPWAKMESVLDPGVHYLEWVYKKDVSLSGGLDAAWIDQVSFPDVSFLEADLQIDTVFPPLATEQLNSITVKGRVVNLGRTTLTSFPLAYRINDAEPVSETFFLKIDPGDTVDVSFTKKCILLADHNYLIYILSKLPEDGYAGNDTAYTSFIRSDAGPDLNEESFRLLPNPFREKLTVEIDITDADRADIELTDITGRIVQRFSEGLVPGTNRITIDGSHLAGGTYMLKVTTGNRSLIRKVVRLR